MLMGCVHSSHSSKRRPEDLLVRQNSKNIDKVIAEEKKKPKPDKILMLGAGDTGKSTICKQIQIIHANGLSNQDGMLSYKAAVQMNLLGNFRLLYQGLNYVHRKLHYKDIDIDATVVAMYESISRCVSMEHLDISLVTVEGIETLRSKLEEQRQKHPRDYEAFINGIPDSSNYFFDNAKRILQPNYMPTTEDCLRARVRTTGIIAIPFDMGGKPFLLVDVGGQRTERKKWIHQFDDVSILLFCASLIDYSQVLEEDTVVNRMKESLALFEQACQTHWFNNTSIVLFLNKMDLLEDRLKRTPFRSAYDDYTGEEKCEPVSQYIEQKFLQIAALHKKTVFTHMTCATNTENMRVVFKIIQQDLINRYMTSGF